MKKNITLFVVFILSQFSTFAQSPQDNIPNVYQLFFDDAYQQYSGIPRGVLEAVAFTNTRFAHLTHDVNEKATCTGIPKAYGVMGLTLDGKNYFNNNLEYVAQLSGFTVAEIINSPEKNILAYAKAFNTLHSSNRTGNKTEDIANVLLSLSEIPNQADGDNFALESQLYVVFTFMEDQEYQKLYHFPEPGLQIRNYFGENYNVLSAPFITISEEETKSNTGQIYKPSIKGNDINASRMLAPDYGPALWNPAASCNYNARSVAITAVAIHDVEGTYAGCISWFKNCASSVSAHYVLRSSDGQITQMVYEADRAWHIGSENGYTIGLEHEGYSNDAKWYTENMYRESAKLVCSICSRRGINKTTCWNVKGCSGGSSTCGISSTYKIKGHQNYPNQSHSDPGPNWNWPHYYDLIQSCGGAAVAPANPTVQQAACPSIGVTLSWQNSGSGWAVDISNDASFATFWNKDVSNLTSLICPGGFCKFNSACTAADFLDFKPNTTYYWRIWNGTAHTAGKSFTTPNCNYSDNNCSGTFTDWNGPNANYSNNLDYTYTIAPVNASTVTMSFTAFDMESNYDFVYFHDGASTASPLINNTGYTGTTLPPSLTAKSGKMTAHFVSDPGTAGAGLSANWTCSIATSIEDLTDATAIAIFPNPSSGKFNLQFSKNKSFVNLTVFDVFGKKIFHLTNPISESVLDLSGYAPGVYTLQVSDERTNYFKKIILQ